MNNQKLGEGSKTQAEKPKTSEGSNLEKKLDVTGWGLFFVWIGIAFIANFGFAAGLIGVGVITLAAQAARKYFNLKLEGFWVVVGLLFVVGGLGELFEIKYQLVPILIIVAGLVMLTSSIWSKHFVK